MGAAALLGLPACQTANSTTDPGASMTEAGEVIDEEDAKALRAAENKARRDAWVERERRKRLLRMNKYYH